MPWRACGWRWSTVRAARLRRCRRTAHGIGRGAGSGPTWMSASWTARAGRCTGVRGPDGIGHATRSTCPPELDATPNARSTAYPAITQPRETRTRDSLSSVGKGRSGSTGNWSPSLTGQSWRRASVRPSAMEVRRVPTSAHASAVGRPRSAIGAGGPGEGRPRSTQLGSQRFGVGAGPALRVQPAQYATEVPVQSGQ